MASEIYEAHMICSCPASKALPARMEANEGVERALARQSMEPLE